MQGNSTTIGLEGARAIRPVRRVEATVRGGLAAALALPSFAPVCAQEAERGSDPAGVVANWNRIESWSGTARIAERRGDQIEHRRVDFVFDRRLRRCRWICEAEPGPGQSRARTGAGSDRTAAMIKDGALYQLASRSSVPGGPWQADRRTIEVCEAPTSGDSAVAGEFDLVHCLTAGGLRMSDLFAGRSADFGPWAVSAEPGVTRAFDPDGCLIGLTRPCAAGSERWTFDYEQRADVWIPARIEVAVENGAGQAVQRTIRFENSVINREIPRSAWDLDRIGAQPGDVVRDARSAAQFVHGGSATAAGTAAANGGGDSLAYYLVLNVGAWVVVLGAAAAISAWSRASANKS